MIRILLVDDDEDCRLLTKDALKRGRIMNETYEVGSAEEALDFIYHRGSHADAPKVGLIYLDIQMAGMSGQELLHVLREDDNLKDVPIVMMTNLRDDREKEAAARAGANSYTCKPADPEEFVHTIVEATQYWIGIHEVSSRRVEESEVSGVAG
jgi:two-component system response regulator